MASLDSVATGKVDQWWARHPAQFRCLTRPMVRQAQNTSSPPLRYSRLTIFARAHGPRRDVYRIDVYQKIRLRTATAPLWNDALSRKPSTRCLVESTAYRRLGVTLCWPRTSEFREMQPITSS